MGQATPDPSRTAVERTVREHWGYILAALVASVRDLQLAEDSLQDAAVAALEHWPASGVPDHPRAWLLQPARRKAIDRLRKAPFKEIIVTDSIPVPREKQLPNLRVLSVAQLLADAIER